MGLLKVKKLIKKPVKKKEGFTGGGQALLKARAAAQASPVTKAISKKVEGTVTKGAESATGRIATFASKLAASRPGKVTKFAEKATMEVATGKASKITGRLAGSAASTVATAAGTAARVAPALAEETGRQLADIGLSVLQQAKPSKWRGIRWPDSAIDPEKKWMVLPSSKLSPTGKRIGGVELHLGRNWRERYIK